MVSRWRIRHKLLLGVCSVAAIMALLLGGTLRGLYSYYLTINNIRELQTERKAVEEFQGAVFDLESREEPAADDAGDPAANPRDALDAVFADFVRLPEKIDTARKKLAAYEELLKDAASRGRDSADVELQSKTVRALQGNFDDLEKAGENLSEAVAVSLAGDKGVADRLRRKIGGQLKTLRCNAKDLCTNVHDDVDRRLNESRSHYQATLWIVVPTSVVGLLILLGLLRSFYAWVFHPIRDLEIGVRRVAGGDFGKPIEVRSGDEMEDLAAAFNDMMKRLRDLYDNLAQQVNERSRQLVRSERLASVGFLAAGVAHEINNPLASIAFCSEALESRLGDLLEQLRASGRGGDDPEVFTRYLRMIQEEAFRCKHITERLLAFSRTGERRREPTDLGKLVQSVLDVTQHLQNARGKAIGFEAIGDRGAAGRIVAAVNAEEIKSVVLNLVVNALDSMDEGGRLTIRLGQREDAAVLQFTDTGCGMTREVLDNIFEPFFTRSRTGKGTGLGLTISHSIISQHGGEIEADSPGPNQGATFTVRLPLRADEAGEAREPPRVAA